jgi:RNA polymerase sigma-70 factor (ECF subfamily)
VLTDEQLVEAALDGSDNAFAEIVQRYQDRLLRFLVARSATQADAEDAIQDTFISAYRYLASFDARWRFSTWLYRIAIRSVARQRRPEPHDTDVELAGDDDPLANCIAHSEHENVWLVARRVLSADAYDAMWLRYVEDQSVREVATALDKSVSWAKVTLMRGRRRLGDELAAATPAALESKSYG